MAGFHLLRSPMEYIPTVSCLSFLTQSYPFTNGHLRVAVQDTDGLVSPLYMIDSMVGSAFWIKYKTTVPSGNFSVIFETFFPSNNYGGLRIDDIVLQPGECMEGKLIGSFKTIFRISVLIKISWLTDSGFRYMKLMSES